jgi:tetratricopeptide (TPR) repeat protein
MLMINGQTEEACRVSRQGYDAAVRSEDKATIALSAVEYATATFECRRVAESLPLFQIALANCRAAHLNYLEPGVLVGISEAHTTLGDWDAGLSFARSSLLLLDDYDDVALVASATACLAVCAFAKGDYLQAQEAYEVYERTYVRVEAILDKELMRAYEPVAEQIGEVHRLLLERNSMRGTGAADGLGG